MGVNSVSRQDLRALYATDVARTPAPQLHGTEAVGKGQEEMPAKAPERALRQSQPKEEQAQRAAKPSSDTPRIQASRFRLRVDEQSQRIVAQILDENDDVVRQVPPEELLKISQRMRQLEGLLFDEST